MSVHRKSQTFTPGDAGRSVTYIDLTPVSVRIAPQRGWLRRLAGWLDNTRARRSLLRCQQIDPRLARDIGLSPTDILRESTAPFWQPVRRR